jgi:N-acetylglucosamine kinase-like BadF-type ATPase
MSGLKMSLFEEQRERLDAKFDELVEHAFDEGWNSVLTILNNVIDEKHRAGDRIAVEVLVYARGRIAGEL